MSEKMRPKKFLLNILLLFLVFSLASEAFCEQPPAGQSVSAGPRRQLATIVFSGLGGAVLGLSTLSFYGRPQDYLQNIAIGFAVGIIVGTIFTTYKAASSPQDFYGTQPGTTSLAPTVRDRDILLSKGTELPLLRLNWAF